MATAATAGVKRTRGDVPVYCGHLATKRARGAAPLPVDNAMHLLLRADGASPARVDARTRALDAAGVTPGALAQLLRIVHGDTRALLALVDLNARAPAVRSVLGDMAARGASVVDLNIRSHAYCTANKATVARAFLASHEQHTLACGVLRFAVTSVFAGEHAVAVRVLSGGGVRDVLLADWCRAYDFCPVSNPCSVPNLVIITAENGRAFLVPFTS